MLRNSFMVVQVCLMPPPRKFSCKLGAGGVGRGLSECGRGAVKPVREVPCQWLFVRGRSEVT